MARANDPFGLIAFASDFLYSRGISHHTEVRTEELADCFRQFFGLPVFARLPDLTALCAKIGIAVDELPLVSDELEAINSWYEDADPAILMRADLATRRAETGFGHEIREIIEISFSRANPKYLALDTDNNDVMNPESDFFASCLLMPAAESRVLMAEIGYDMVRFSAETGRSLASVILRAQALFSEGTGIGPVAGFWLFEAPWKKGAQLRIPGEELPVAYRAHLNGFSMDKSKGQTAKIARLAFPQKGDRISGHRLAYGSLLKERVQTELLPGFDIFRELDFYAVAEPLFFRNAAPRVLLAAVRLDALGQVRPWLSRVGALEAIASASAPVS